MIDYTYVLKEFKKYTEKFNNKDSMIAMKISHSYHVSHLANILAKRLEISKEKIELAKVIGLLHDIGRFEQYVQSKLYNDIESQIDHGLLAIEYLFKENHINDFKIPKKYHKIIEKSIFNHNKLKIEAGLTKDEEFFSKLLRDVDKIDIFRQEATREQTFKEPISLKVKQQYYEHHLVDGNFIKTKSDFFISEIAYVFDIQFQESFELLVETDNLELYLSVIDILKEYDKDFEDIKKEVRNFIEERCR